LSRAAGKFPKRLKSPAWKNQARTPLAELKADLSLELPAPLEPLALAKPLALLKAEPLEPPALAKPPAPLKAEPLELPPLAKPPAPLKAEPLELPPPAIILFLHLNSQTLAQRIFASYIYLQSANRRTGGQINCKALNSPPAVSLL
jgi:hypothetical protein